MRLSSSSSKPISSPGRAVAEKFPPPLLKFLRSNASSRSRPRSRKTPLFLRKKKTTAPSAAAEPSSPKVTCIGQVRVRRSKSGSKKSGPKLNKTRCPGCNCSCSCFRNPCFCSCDSITKKKNLFRAGWCIWVPVFFCGSAKVRTDSPQTGSNRIEFKEEEEVETQQREVKNGREALASASTPPKNALLLTRCRSAPYRSSSLACQFWGSPLKTEEDRETEAQKTEQEESRETAIALGSEIEGRDSAVGTREEESGGGGVAIEEDLKETPPLMKLMRCRSEPGRRGGSENLDPLTSKFWRERRLSNTENCTPLSGD